MVLPSDNAPEACGEIDIVRLLYRIRAICASAGSFPIARGIVFKLYPVRQACVNISAGAFSQSKRRSDVSIETQLLESIRALPPERQAEVLDFAEFIRHRSARQISPRPAGLCQGEFVVPDDFDAPLPDEVLREFES